MLLEGINRESNASNKEGSLLIYAEKGKQASCSNWGIWGREKYSFREDKLNEKKILEQAKLQECLKDANLRLKFALNFSYGQCDLSGYASPITPEEFQELAAIHQESEQKTSFIKESGIRFLVQELYCIRKVSADIPGFCQGKLVNDGSNPELHRQYVYLDFFKFSLINLLIRVDGQRICKLPPPEMAAYLVLSWFLGVGSFIEKANIFFSKEAQERIAVLCRKIVCRIEERIELPLYDLNLFEEELQELICLISAERMALEEQSFLEKSTIQRMSSLRLCETYYKDYFNLDFEAVELKKPLVKLKKLLEQVKHASSYLILNIQGIKQFLRNLRYSLDEKYKAFLSECPNELKVHDFFDKTTHPYFSGLQCEAQILGVLFKIENPGKAEAASIESLFREIVPFYSCKYEKGKGLFNTQSSALKGDDYPLLVIDHHTDNGTIERLKDVMVINRLAKWPIEKQVLNISSTSSDPKIVQKERELCIELGFNFYRTHTKQSLFGDNKSRSIFNALDLQGQEYYLTLDDDCFVFPEFPEEGHRLIKENGLDYYQAPLAFKGMYKLNCLNGERANAEATHYWECSGSRDIPGTYMVSQGAGAIISFKDGFSPISERGGGLTDNASRGFGQELLSYLQGSSLEENQKHQVPKGMKGENVLCIGEEVDLSGKLMQVVRRGQETTNMYFNLYIPALFRSMLNGKADAFLSSQALKTLLFIPGVVTAKIFALMVVVAPFVFYTFHRFGYQLFNSFLDERFLLISMGILLFLLFVSQYSVVQKRLSFSSLRLLLMDYLLLSVVVYGYIRGILGMKLAYWPKKSQKVKWKIMAGPVFLFLINAVTAFFASQKQLPTLSSWAFIQASFIFIGFVLFNIKSGPWSNYLPVRVNWFLTIMVLTLALLSAFSFFIIEVYPKSETLYHKFYFYFIVLFMLSPLIGFSDLFLFLLKRKKLSIK